MSGHLFVSEGTALASPGFTVDVLGDAGFTAKQVLVVNNHSTLSLTIAGLPSVGNLTILPGEKALIPGSVKRFRVIEATGVATFRCIASDSVTPGADLDTYLLVSAGIANGAVGDAQLVADTTEGISAQRTFRAVYDFAVEGGAISEIDLGVNLPANASITMAKYYVVTTCTSATDAGTMSMGVNTESAAGILAPAAISTGTTFDNTGAWVDCLPDGSAANMTAETTVARAIVATIAVEAFTAGKILIVGQYLVSE